MENPATWGPAEKIVNEVLGGIALNLARPAEEKLIGLSAARQVTNALREAGLLRHAGFPEGTPHALLGCQVMVVLDLSDEKAVSRGKLLGFGDGGSIEILEDDMMIHYCWPALQVKERES